MIFILLAISSKFPMQIEISYAKKLPHDIPCGSFNIFIDKIIFLILIFRLMNDIFQHLCSLSKLISYVSYQPS